MDFGIGNPEFEANFREELKEKQKIKGKVYQDITQIRDSYANNELGIPLLIDGGYSYNSHYRGLVFISNDFGDDMDERTLKYFEKKGIYLKRKQSYPIEASVFIISLLKKLRIYVTCEVEDLIIDYYDDRKEAYQDIKYYIIKVSDYKGQYDMNKRHKIEQFDFISEIKPGEIQSNEISDNFFILTLQREIKEGLEFYRYIEDAIRNERQYSDPIKNITLIRHNLLRTLDSELLNKNLILSGTYKTCAYICRFTPCEIDGKPRIYVNCRVSEEIFDEYGSLRDSGYHNAPLCGWIKDQEWNEELRNKFYHEKFNISTILPLNQYTPKEHAVITRFEFISDLDPNDINDSVFLPYLRIEVKEGFDFYESVNKSLGYQKVYRSMWGSDVELDDSDYYKERYGL